MSSKCDCGSYNTIVFHSMPVEVKHQDTMLPCNLRRHRCREPNCLKTFTTVQLRGNIRFKDNEPVAIEFEHFSISEHG
jgi:hypothetical protein